MYLKLSRDPQETRKCPIKVVVKICRNLGFFLFFGFFVDINHRDFRNSCILFLLHMEDILCGYILQMDRCE